MGIAKHTERPDGSVTATVKRMEKTIRAPNGQFRKMVSYDGGEHWRMDAKAERRRIVNSTRLHGAKWLKAQEKKHDIANNAGTETPPGSVILPVEHRGSTFLGKAVGKNQKYHKALKPRRPEREVPIMRPVHRHRCHSKTYLCSCDTPYFRRPCGGSKGCIHNLMAAQFTAASTVNPLNTSQKRGQ